VTADELIAFEKEIAADFEAGKIAAPVHLAGGNEQHLIRIFKQIKPDDWVCCQWRSHYHCLLKGVPPEQLRKAIHDGRSIALCFPEHRILSSAIVGGIAPIAMGIAYALKAQKSKVKVWCFIGDMTARSGIVYETAMYADGHDLPIIFVVENNHMSVCTDTIASWGTECWYDDMIQHEYLYKLTWPHVGTGVFVKF